MRNVSDLAVIACALACTSLAGDIWAERVNGSKDLVNQVVAVQVAYRLRRVADLHVGFGRGYRRRA